MNDRAHALLRSLQQRSHVAPKRLVAPGPDATQRALLFEAAATAPDHGQIRPWRLIEVTPARRPDLGNAFVQALLERDAAATEMQIAAAFEKALRAPLLLLAVVSNAPQGEGNAPFIPPAERLISLGCAIQNMLLMAEAMDMGSGITSGQAMQSHSVRDLFKLSDHEDAICFVSVGTVAARKPPRERPPYHPLVSTL